MVKTERRYRHTAQIKEMQVSQLRRMIRIDDMQTRDYKFKRVTRADDFFNALRLVQKVYIQEGYVDPKTDAAPFRILKNHHHDKTAVFIGKKGKQVAFTVSLFPDTSWGLPMDAIFKKELDYLRSQGRSIGEVGCLATHPEHRHGTQNVVMHGNKIMFSYAMEHLKLDDLVITVHPKHVLVYKEVLLFDELNPGTVKNYSTVNNNPAVALRLDLHKVEEKFKRYYKNNSLETNLHHFFFLKHSSNIDLITNRQQQYQFARSVYPGQVHAARTQ